MKKTKSIGVVPAEAPIETSSELVPTDTKRKEIVLEGDPDEQLAFAAKAARALMSVVSQKAKPVMIRGEQYIEFGDWQVLGRFYGATVAVEWTKSLIQMTGPGKDLVTGYEARAVVYRNGEIISAAEAMCLRDERNWKDRDEFMLKSMAQTRASAKALRNAFGWVAELAGYKSTPAEEMEGIQRDATPTQTKIVPEAPTVAVPSAEETKAKIKELLKMLGHKPKTVGEAGEIILQLTGLDFIEYNIPRIIEKLEASKERTFQEIQDENAANEPL